MADKRSRGGGALKKIFFRVTKAPHTHTSYWYCHTTGNDHTGRRWARTCASGNEAMDQSMTSPKLTEALRPLCATGSETSASVKSVCDTISKIRARQSVRIEESYNFIRGSAQLRRTVRAGSGPPKSIPRVTRSPLRR